MKHVHSRLMFVIGVVVLIPSVSLGQHRSKSQYPPPPWNVDHWYLGGDSLRLGPEMPGMLNSAFAEKLRDPYSAKYTVSTVQYVYAHGVISGYVCGTVNSKNGVGGYGQPIKYAIRVTGFANELNHYRPEVSLSDPLMLESPTEFRLQAYAELCNTKPAPSNESPWIGQVSKKEFYSAECLVVRKIPVADRQRFWLASDALAAGYVHTSVPGC